MPDTSSMSQEELDRWSDINNPNNDADMDGSVQNSVSFLYPMQKRDDT
jgi:hypothetical protein